MSPHPRSGPQPAPAARHLRLVAADRRVPAPAACAACAVRPQTLLCALSEEEARAAPGIAPRLHVAGSLLYARGEAAHHAYTVHRGVVRFERVTERGDRRIVRLAGPGDLIGHEALAATPRTEDAIACTPVELCTIASDALDMQLARSPALRAETMRRWQRALDAGAGWAADVCAGPARRRLLMLLSLLQRHAGADGTVWLPPRDVIGDMLDIAMETASRLVSGLRRDGVLDPLPGQAARVHPEALQRALAAENR